jgi:hypothetical protein
MKTAWLLLLIAIPAQAAQDSPTVAMQALSGKPLKAGEIFTAPDKPLLLVDRANTKIELAPFAVVEFSIEGQMKLLRGSALVEGRGERSLRTSSAQVDFTGRLLVSYDHKDRSTSAFVFEGEGRMVNPHQPDRTLRLERFKGATLEVGGVFPQLIRDLNFATVESWMRGYAWPEALTKELTKELPRESTRSVASAAPAHLSDTKLEDYFSAIDTADEFSQPDYYEKKFADSDQVAAEANSKKQTGKEISPEEAALISLPNTKIDLEFEIITPGQKEQELAAILNPKSARGLASVPAAKKVAPVKAKTATDGLDPEVTQVLERLRRIQNKTPVISQVPVVEKSRRPASLETGLVPDPVYDYSQNF